MAGLLDMGGLAFDGGGAVENAFGIPPEDGLLLLVQAGQQFAVLLQLHPQRLDQVLNGWIHGRVLPPVLAAWGVEAVTWEDEWNWSSRLRATPKEPDWLIWSARRSTIMSW